MIKLPEIISKEEMQHKDANRKKILIGIGLFWSVSIPAICALVGDAKFGENMSNGSLLLTLVITFIMMMLPFSFIFYNDYSELNDDRKIKELDELSKNNPVIDEWIRNVKSKRYLTNSDYSILVANK